jgi:hypothetical protein
MLGYDVGRIYSWGEIDTTPSTFIVRILRTDNGTWQGRIGHTQTGEMRTFQSCLEMLRIMDEIAGTAPQAEQKGDRAQCR